MRTCYKEKKTQKSDLNTYQSIRRKGLKGLNLKKGNKSKNL